MDDSLDKLPPQGESSPSLYTQGFFLSFQDAREINPI